MGLAGLVGAFLLIHDSDRWMYRGGFVLFAVLALGVIILASGDTFVSRAMSHPVLRRIGFLSYALYLWHWPVRVFATDTRLHLPDSSAGDWAGVILRLAITFGLSWLSMELVERWFRRSQLGVARFGLAWLGIGAILVALAVLAVPSGGSTIENSAGGDQTAQRERTLAPVDDPTRPTLLIVGDSVAVTLENGVRRVIDPDVVVVGGGELGCAILTSPKALSFDGTWGKDGTECPDHDDYWKRLVEARTPDVVVLLAGAWDLYARDWGNGAVVPGDPEFDRNYRSALAASLGVLASEGAEVIVMTTPCFAPNAGERAGPQHDPDRARRLADLQREVVDEFNESSPTAPASIVDLQAVSCDNGFTTTRDGVSWRPDGTHFSVDGAQVAARWLLSSLPDSARSRLQLIEN